MTMRIEVKTVLCGPMGSFKPGDIADVDDAQAEALIAGGYARRAPEPAQAPAPAPVEIETAAAAPAETADTPKRRRRRKASPVAQASLDATTETDNEGTDNTDG